MRIVRKEGAQRVPFHSVHQCTLRLQWLPCVTTLVTIIAVIKSFTHKGLEVLFRKGSTAKIQVVHAKRLRLILAQLNKAQTLADMNIPSLGLHELKGDRKGTWSVTVQANWRVTFRFVNSDVEQVNYEDYH